MTASVVRVMSWNGCISIPCLLMTWDKLCQNKIAQTVHPSVPSGFGECSVFHTFSQPAHISVPSAPPAPVQCEVPCAVSQSYIMFTLCALMYRSRCCHMRRPELKGLSLRRYKPRGVCLVRKSCQEAGMLTKCSHRMLRPFNLFSKTIRNPFCRLRLHFFLSFFNVASVICTFLP